MGLIFHHDLSWNSHGKFYILIHCSSGFTYKLWAIKIMHSQNSLVPMGLPFIGATPVVFLSSIVANLTITHIFEDMEGFNVLYKNPSHSEFPWLTAKGEGFSPFTHRYSEVLIFQRRKSCCWFLWRKHPSESKGVQTTLCLQPPSITALPCTLVKLHFICLSSLLKGGFPNPFFSPFRSAVLLPVFKL